jgi:hypothetical protein
MLLKCKLLELGVMVHACNSSIEEVEKGGMRVCGQSRLYSEIPLLKKIRLLEIYFQRSLFIKSGELAKKFHFILYSI